MRILQVEQGTKEWHDGRMCKVTGTKLESVMGTPYAQSALIAEFLAEEATEQSKILRSTEEMERGNTEEVFAVRTYEDRTGKKVDRIGMCVHDEYDWLALSPDGLIQNAEGKYTEAVEVKCPDSKKAMLYKIQNVIPMEETGLMGARGPLASAPFLGIPADYKWQAVQYFIVNPDLEVLHFLTYDVRFINDELKLYVVDLHRSNEVLQETIKEAEEALHLFREKWMRWRDIILPTNF